MRLKNAYSVSLCKNGILGGLLYVEDQEMVFCTNKLTVPQSIRRLHIAYDRIQSIEKAPWHTVLISMKNGESYRFLVFSREKLLQQVSQNLPT